MRICFPEIKIFQVRVCFYLSEYCPTKVGPHWEERQKTKQTKFLPLKMPSHWSSAAFSREGTLSVLFFCLSSQIKEILIMPPDLALLSILIGSNYPSLELIFMVPPYYQSSLARTTLVSSTRSGGIIRISLIFYNIKVCCVFSLESPHWGESNEYTQYTVFKIKKKKKTHLIIPNLQPRDFFLGT